MTARVQLSVILPAYNASAYVGEAIDSILGQDFGDFELLIADDGSTDDTLAKIQSYKDERIRIIINEKNLGLIGTLNRLVNEAKGEFVARMDADDIAAPNRFSAQLKVLRENPDVTVVSSLMGIINEPGRVVKHRFRDDAYVKAGMLFTNPIVHPAVVFRKDKLPSGELYNKEFLHAEDYGLWTELITSAVFHVIPSPLLHHRSHEQQVSVEHYAQQKRSISKAHAHLCKQMGIQPTEEELELQLSLFLELFEASDAYVDKVDAWLNRLVETNSKTRLLPVAAFEDVAGEWWFRVCQSLNTGIKRYNQSRLSELYSPPLKSKAKLIAKSIVPPRKSNPR